MQSLFLESLAGQQQQAAEVALAQAAAREAVGERGQLEQMLTWLTGAHAEEAALHRTFKAEVLSTLLHASSLGDLKTSQACSSIQLHVTLVRPANTQLCLLPLTATELQHA